MLDNARDGVPTIAKRLTVRPESGPRPAPCWHMDRVHDDESECERVRRGDADAHATARDSRRRLDAHDCVARAVDLGQVRSVLEWRWGKHPGQREYLEEIRTPVSRSTYVTAPPVVESGPV